MYEVGHGLWTWAIAVRNQSLNRITKMPLLNSESIKMF